MYKKNVDRAAEIRAAQMLAEMKGSVALAPPNEDIRVQTSAKKEVVQVVPQKVESVKVAVASSDLKTSHENLKQNVWSDYGNDGKPNRENVLAQMERNLPLLDVPMEGIEVFKQLVQFQEFRWGTIQTGDRVLAVAVNGKVIYPIFLSAD